MFGKYRTAGAPTLEDYRREAELWEGLRKINSKVFAIDTIEDPRERSNSGSEQMSEPKRRLPPHKFGRNCN
jgi:hypothetical protein